MSAKVNSVRSNVNEGGERMTDFEDFVEMVWNAAKKAENKDAIKDGIKEVYGLYAEMVEAGFSKEQSFELLKIMMEKAM